jgi:hypothetical protein
MLSPFQKVVKVVKLGKGCHGKGGLGAGISVVTRANKLFYVDCSRQKGEVL